MTSLTAKNAGYTTDAWSNTPSSILSRMEQRLYLNDAHPLGIIRSLIEQHFGSRYAALRNLDPIVTTKQNFDDLGFPLHHPGRSKSDTYYLNRDNVLRTHTSAHEIDTFKEGHDRWLLAADVYRRDEIDASHYPVFHQMEGACVLPSDTAAATLDAESAELEARLLRAGLIVDDQTQRVTPDNPYQLEHDATTAEAVRRNLKANLNALTLSLFGGHGPLEIRWIEAYFPFTSPSYEVEVKFAGKWLEILGCGVVRHRTLELAGQDHKIGWAFGLGLERLAMILFGVPDIRLFWSKDQRFAEQFRPGQVSTFKAYSRYPPVLRDVSFWLPEGKEGEAPWSANDFFEVVREVAGDLVESTRLVRRSLLFVCQRIWSLAQIDDFEHPKTKRRSLCYSLSYRSFDRCVSPCLLSGIPNSNARIAH